MQTLKHFTKITFALALTGVAVSSCKKKIEEKIVPVTEYVNVPSITPAFRASFDYSRLAAKTPYDSLFLDVAGLKTVDLTEGNLHLLMMADLVTYAATSNSGTAKLDSNLLKNKFANFNSPFATIPSGVTGYTVAQLNSSVVQLRNATGVSSNQTAVWDKLEGFFSGIDVASASIADTAKAGLAGKVFTVPNPTTGAVSKYLLDAQGVELNQLIQKGLIGSFEYDYIANVLLSDNSINSADNSRLVTGKNYTQLEHNWDVAFGLLTLNKVYAINATNTSSTGERYLGSYLREYGNSAFDNDYLKIHPAFLKGRAAVVNNDLEEAKAQAKIIKTIIEKVMARAGAEYIKKWKENTDQAAGKHQLAEGLGFVYSLRFCNVHGADAAFSDGLLNDLIYSNTNGVWGLTPVKAEEARAKIMTQFGL